MGMRLRLGFWNRLALVVGVLFTVIAPTWLNLSNHQRALKAREGGFEACVSGVGKANSDLTYEFCRETWLAPPTGHLGWAHWLESAAIFAGIALFLYGLIWASVLVVKWILRGRSAAA